MADSMATSESNSQNEVGHVFKLTKRFERLIENEKVLVHPGKCQREIKQTESSSIQQSHVIKKKAPKPHTEPRRGKPPPNLTQDPSENNGGEENNGEQTYQTEPIVNETIEKEDTNRNNDIQQLRQESTNMSREILEVRQQTADLKSEIQQLQEKIVNKNIQKLRREKNNKDDDNIKKVLKRNDELQAEIEQLKKDNIFSFCEGVGSVVVSKEVLGKGSWGTVMAGDFYGTKVAVKEFHEIVLSPHNEEILGREIKIASQCRHPNLLQFICATENIQHQLLIVTELMDMTLRKLLQQRAKERSQLKDHEIKSVSLDVARGLNYLHLKMPSPVIHRDVSSNNVLLWIHDGLVVRAKVSDYGSANFMDACNTARPGAAVYAAPEAIQAQHDPKIDVFSYGLLVCEMSICQLPFPEQGKRRSQIDRIPNIVIKELVKRCTKIEPQQRPSMLDVIAFWQHIPIASQ